MLLNTKVVQFFALYAYPYKYMKFIILICFCIYSLKSSSSLLPDVYKLLIRSVHVDQKFQD